jgi:DGQHR domain-containing protein
MPEKGSELNKRVWSLFERAGFKTKPNSQDPTEEVIKLSDGKSRTVDLCAIDDNLRVKIIGWNKARRDFTESFTVHLHDYQQLMQITQAQSVLFVSIDKELTEEDREYAKINQMRVWGKEELEYYEALTDAIGNYAKYEIIHSFGIATDEEKHIHNVLALHMHQPFSESSADIFLFTITPDVLLKTCAVFRKAQGNKAAYQRILQKKRLGSIRKFVTQSDALLPPNIIVHFSNNIRWEPLAIPTMDSTNRGITLTKQGDYELVLLSIPKEYASLELIDGQHRLYGFLGTEPATKQHFNLVVLGLANIPPEKRTSTFIAINDNARRMDPNLVAYLKLNNDEDACQKDSELMAIKVTVELNRTTPFKKKIRLFDVGNQKITLKGFAGYDLKGLISPRGQLRKYYRNDSKEYVQVLRVYFSQLKSLFPEQWKDPDKYIIFTNRGTSAFLKLLKSILKTHKKPLDPQTIIKYLKPLRDNWKESWEIKKLRNAYVGSQGWKNFHRDLVKTIMKCNPDFKE